MNTRKVLLCILTILFLLLINAGMLYYIFDRYQLQKESTTTSLSGKILWHGNNELPEIALTFDDGPNSKTTPKILDILKDHEVKATFFVLGKSIEKNKDILKRTAAEGHSIGNHTYTHADGKITDTGKIIREFSRTSSLITKYTGMKVKHFRPPFGYENWRFLIEAEKGNYDIVLWSLDVADWDKKKNEKDMASMIARRTRNGTIILLHDGGASREAVINSLPQMIDGLKKKGYKFVTIDEMVSHLQ